MLARKLDTNRQLYRTKKFKRQTKRLTKPLKKTEIDFPVTLTLGLIFVSILFSILALQQSAQLMSRQYYFCELTATRESLEGQNLKLVNDFNTLKSLDRIENIATQEFKMSRPDFEKNVIIVEVEETETEENVEINNTLTMR